jgi:hypothetical protein
VICNPTMLCTNRRLVPRFLSDLKEFGQAVKPEPTAITGSPRVLPPVRAQRNRTRLADRVSRPVVKFQPASTRVRPIRRTGVFRQLAQGPALRSADGAAETWCLKEDLSVGGTLRTNPAQNTEQRCVAHHELTGLHSRRLRASQHVRPGTSPPARSPVRVSIPAAPQGPRLV